MSSIKIRRALVSVSDKTDVVDLCSVLTSFGTEILSTGGTATKLRDAGIAVKDVSEHTGFPEMMDGRVKTLHPMIHGGLLALRDNSEHMQKAEEHSIGMIDMVVVNLYPFEETISKPGVDRATAVEQIDIGGPSMVRSAAKNHVFVAVVTSPDQYKDMIAELKDNDGALGLETRKRLAISAFNTTACYDTAISAWLVGQEDDVPSYPERHNKIFCLRQSLRYGENPHQTAAFYADVEDHGTSLAQAEQISGKELSYNNILDTDGALRLVMEFEEPAAVVVKHTNPCGCATGSSIGEAFVRAYDGDPLSAFGGIVALNRGCDAATASAIIDGNKFLELIIAPGFDDEAVEIIVKKNPKKWRKSIRLLSVGAFKQARHLYDLRAVSGGMLVQSRDMQLMDAEGGGQKVPTQTKPDELTMKELLFAWRVVKHIKSNAICLTQGQQLMGMGAGQTSRVDAVQIAIRKSGDKARGSVLASDAFFPFPDSIELAKEAGITAIVQPGGSVRDGEVIAACDEAGIAMMFTGMRHFRH